MKAQSQKNVEMAKEDFEKRTVWRFDPSHTSVEFSVKNLLFFTVRGSLSILEGTLLLDEADINQSSVSATLKVDGIDTGNRRRDVSSASAVLLRCRLAGPRFNFKVLRLVQGRTGTSSCHRHTDNQGKQRRGCIST